MGRRKVGFSARRKSIEEAVLSLRAAEENDFRMSVDWCFSKYGPRSINFSGEISARAKTDALTIWGSDRNMD